MPEILTTIPPLKLTTVDNVSSETDGGITTDRSTTTPSPTITSAAIANAGGASVDAVAVNVNATRATQVRQQQQQANKRRQAQENNLNQIKKTRKSFGRRNMKKITTPTTAPRARLVGSPQKSAAALYLKSQIPRALLLTPSSSSASLITNRSRQPSPEPNTIKAFGNAKCKNAKTVKPQNTLTAEARSVELSNTKVVQQQTSCSLELVKAASNSHSQTTTTLQRQQTTAAILNFRIRKSITQMDFRRKRCAENNNYQMLAAMHSASSSASSPSSSALSGGGGGLSRNATRALVTHGNAIDGYMGAASQSSLVNKIFDQNNYYYVVQDRDPKVAGMRIFATIMLNAWRKRRDEVKRLMEEVNDLKRGSIKAKNQLHVFNTLFRVEQKRNDELSLQLKRSLEDINNTKSSCESLTTSLISLKADKALLEQQIQMKEQEFDGLNSILSQTKSDLFKTMAQQRELQANLSCELRKVQALEVQKNELINEICQINNDSLLKEENLRNEMKEKDDAITAALTRIETLESEIAELKNKTILLDNCLEVESRLRKELATLTREVDTLQKCLAATLGNRLRHCWQKSLAYQRATLQLFHWIAWCALPATPPPRINTFPFAFTFGKALSIVKR